MKNSGTFLVLLGAATVSVCSGLMVGPVRLQNTQMRYISYQSGPSAENTTLECPVELESSDEEVAQVSWVLWRDDQEAGTFQWTPDGLVEATGLLEYKAHLGRDDGSLELTELQYDLAGFYSCAVTLTNDDTAEAEKWELLIIDTTSNHIWTSSKSSNCQYVASYRAYAVFPRPTIQSGMYSTSNRGFYDQVTAQEWKEQVYSNGSVAFSYNDRNFTVDERTPVDVKFLTLLGVDKQDGTRIALTQELSSSIIWTERGCPPSKLEANQKALLIDIVPTCRGEFKPTSSSTGQVEISCKEGYKPAGEVATLTFHCRSESLTWNPSPSALRDLECVYDNGATSMTLGSLTLVLVSALLPRLLH